MDNKIHFKDFAVSLNRAGVGTGAMSRGISHSTHAEANIQTVLPSSRAWSYILAPPAMTAFVPGPLLTLA